MCWRVVLHGHRWLPCCAMLNTLRTILNTQRRTHCKLHTAHFTLHTTHYYTLYTLHINPHPKCCPHTLKARLHSRGTTSRQRTARRHTSLCTRHTTHYTLHTTHYALHTTHLTRTPHPKCVGALQSDDISLPCWCVVRCSTPETRNPKPSPLFIAGGRHLGDVRPEGERRPLSGGLLLIGRQQVRPRRRVQGAPLPLPLCILPERGSSEACRGTLLMRAPPA